MMLLLCELIKTHQPEPAKIMKTLTLNKICLSKCTQDMHTYAGMLLSGASAIDEQALCGHEGYGAVALQLSVLTEAYNTHQANEDRRDVHHFNYKLLTEKLVDTWSLEYCEKGNAYETSQTVWRILGLLSFELAFMRTTIKSYNEIVNGRLLSQDVRNFLFLFTHCILCLCEWGMAAFDRTDVVPGLFNLHQLYLLAAALLDEMTSSYIYPNNQSLHRIIQAEPEVLSELAWVCVLLETPGVFTPPGMRITPLHLYRIMNQHLFNDEGRFEEEKYAYLQGSPNSVYNVQITFSLFRATLERAWLYGDIPTLPMRRNCWLDRYISQWFPYDLVVLMEDYAGAPPLGHYHMTHPNTVDLTGE